MSEKRYSQDFDTFGYFCQERSPFFGWLPLLTETGGQVAFWDNEIDALKRWWQQESE